jgi:hypothetical protein
MDQPIGDAMRSTYRGSHIFSFAAKRTGLGLDQFNFLIAEILAFIFAICFRRYLPPKPNNLIKRHLIGKIVYFILFVVTEIKKKRHDHSCNINNRSEMVS